MSAYPECIHGWSNPMHQCPECKIEDQLDQLRHWQNLGLLTVAIANGEALPSSATEVDDNPVNCISVTLKERDELKQKVADLEEGKP